MTLGVVFFKKQNTNIMLKGGTSVALYFPAV